VFWCCLLNSSRRSKPNGSEERSCDWDMFVLGIYGAYNRGGVLKVSKVVYMRQ
jgi:hypothetical protein